MNADVYLIQLQSAMVSDNTLSSYESIETRSVANITLLQTLQNNLDIGEAEAITPAALIKCRSPDCR